MLIPLSSAYWIAFGPHGPRKLPDPGEKWVILRWTLGCLTASAIIFGTGRYFAKPPPKTMTKEWQEMTNEYLKVSAYGTPNTSRLAMNGMLTLLFNRRKSQKPSRVFRQRVTRVLVWCRALQVVSQNRYWRRVITLIS